MEKSRPAEEPTFSQCLLNAELAAEQGQFDSAESWLKTIKRNFGVPHQDHENYVKFQHVRGILLYHRDKYAESIAVLEGVLNSKQSLGDAKLRASLLRDLGAATRAYGMIEEGILLSLEARAAFKTLGKRFQPEYAAVCNNLAVAFYNQSNYPEAERQIREAIGIRESTFTRWHSLVGQSLSVLAEIYCSQGRLSEAIDICERSIEAHERSDSTVQLELANSLNNLGVIKYSLGDYEGAERAFEQTIDIESKILEPNSLDLATDRQNLAETYRQRKRFDKARAMHEDVMMVREAKLDHNHPDLGTTYCNLGNVLSALGETDLAEKYLLKAIKIDSALSGDGKSNDLAASLCNLGQLYNGLGQYDCAHKTMKRAIAAVPSGSENSSPHLVALNNLADLAEHRNDLIEAEALFNQVLTARRFKLPKDHPDLAHSLSRYARVLRKLGKYSNSLNISRQAVSIVLDRLRHSSIFSVAQTVDEIKMAREILLSHCRMLLGGNSRRFEMGDANCQEFLVLLQYCLMSETALSAAKIVGGSDPNDRDFGGQIAEISRLKKSIGRVETRLHDLQNSAMVVDFKESIQRLEGILIRERKALSDAESQVRPELFQLYELKAFELYEIFEALHSKEGILFLTIGTGFGISALLTSDGVFAHEISCTEKQLIEYQDEVRHSLDLRTNSGEPNPFALATANKYVHLLLAENVSNLQQLSHLICLKDPILSRVPFFALPVPTHSTAQENIAAEKCNEVAWLIDLVPVTDVVSLQSVCEWRKTKTNNNLKQSFLGFGAPMTDSPFLQELPRTERQLSAVSSAFEEANSRLVLGLDANKEQFRKSVDRAPHVLAFATHGFTAEEAKLLGGPAEPALLLSGKLPDCLLTASEIAKMRIDADWVILCACNSAAGEGSGQDGYSGLVRAFHESGCRTLLVSHWWVSEFTTARLLEHMFDEQQQGRFTRPEMLRRASLSIRDTGLPKHRHPAYWAAFSLVGGE